MKTDPCNPTPCGPNAQCDNGVCTCLPEYQGDPYLGCRPECVLNGDCPRDKSCIGNKCLDPCPNLCGQNAECSVLNHIPICSCQSGWSGDPFSFCRRIESRYPPGGRYAKATTANFFVVQQPKNPCSPSPCGPNSVCREINGQAVCSCVLGYIGAPPTCRPECVVSSECRLHQSCVNQKCVDPCPGSCGLSATCQVVNHNPICSCPSGFTGDPFSRCYRISKSTTLLSLKKLG